MATLYTESNGCRRVQFAGADKKRRSVRLGKVPLKLANEIKLKVEALNAASLSGMPIDPETARWVARVGDDLAAKLAAAGLIAPRGAATLDGFIVGYIAGRTDIKPRTRIDLEQARARMVPFFGDVDLRSITPARADEWARHLKQERGYAEATVARTIKRAKQLFTAARRSRLVEENPFEHLKAGSMVNAKRLFFVTSDVAAKVLDACPSAEWRTIFALARFGGLRCPSEVLALTWDDVDWERGRFLVRSPKMEHVRGKAERWVPIFPELRPHLEEQFERAEPGTVHVITRTRDDGANFRTTFGKIVKRAGLSMWERPFQNLRASRETELAATFPLHVVTAWIGNSEIIAAKHYLQVTDADFAAAVQNPVQTGAARGGRERTTAGEGKEEKPEDSPSSAPVLCCPIDKVLPAGLEPAMMPGCDPGAVAAGPREYSFQSGRQESNLPVNRISDGCLAARSPARIQLPGRHSNPTRLLD
jgi:integrase